MHFEITVKDQDYCIEGYYSERFEDFTVEEIQLIQGKEITDLTYFWREDLFTQSFINDVYCTVEELLPERLAEMKQGDPDWLYDQWRENEL